MDEMRAENFKKSLEPYETEVRKLDAERVNLATMHKEIKTLLEQARTLDLSVNASSTQASPDSLKEKVASLDLSRAAIRSKGDEFERHYNTYQKKAYELSQKIATVSRSIDPNASKLYSVEAIQRMRPGG